MNYTCLSSALFYDAEECRGVAIRPIPHLSPLPILATRGISSFTYECGGLREA